MTKPYVPIGMNPSIGDYEGPLVGAEHITGQAALAWFRRQKYYFNDGRVKRHVPKTDKDGDRSSWADAPKDAPVFNYDTANAIKKDIHLGAKPIDALLKHVPASDLNPQWLKRNGAPESMIPTSAVYATAKALEAIGNAMTVTPEIRAKILAANGVTEEQMSGAPKLPVALTEGIEPEIDEDVDGEVDESLYEDDVAEDLQELEA